MKHTLTLLAAALLSLSAHATHCPNGIPDKYYPTCVVPPVTPPAPTPTPAPVKVKQQQHQGQDQQQGQAQAQSLRSSNRNANRNTNTLQGGDQSLNVSVQNTIAQGDAGATPAAAAAASGFGGESFDNRVIVHPSMIPPSPVAINPQGNLLAVQTGCGPWMEEDRTPVYAQSPTMFGSEQKENGYTSRPRSKIGANGEILLYDRVPQADGSTVLIGSLMVIGMTITNQSGAANLAAGFIRSNGAGGQIGGGASAAMQQAGTTTLIVPCIAGIVPAPGAAQARVVEPRPAVVIRPAPRRPVARPVATTQPGPSCMATAAASCQAKPDNTLKLTAPGKTS